MKHDCCFHGNELTDLFFAEGLLQNIVISLSKDISVFPSTLDTAGFVILAMGCGQEMKWIDASPCIPRRHSQDPKRARIAMEGGKETS